MIVSRLSGRERYLAVITASIIALALLYAVIIAPISATMASVNARIRAKLISIEKDRKILAGQDILASEYARLSKNARMPGSEEQASADTLAYLEKIATNDGCFIVNMKPLGTSDNGTHKELLFDVTAEGGMSQFTKLLYDMEHPRDVLVNVKRFTLTSKSGQPGILKGTFLIGKMLLD